MLFIYFVEQDKTTKASNNVVVIYDVMCCTNLNVGRSEIHIWEETIDFYIFVLSTLNNTPKMMDDYCKTHSCGIPNVHSCDSNYLQGRPGEQVFCL